ncbi:MAG: hypothetical protein EPO24_16690 [Bacteroidetes bacterium]|nr:MAG: hypothetical protein EPO24_16690 [Bacteroidota bacterium]
MHARKKYFSNERLFTLSVGDHRVSFPAGPAMKHAIITTTTDSFAPRMLFIYDGRKFGSRSS